MMKSSMVQGRAKHKIEAEYYSSRFTWACSEVFTATSKNLIHKTAQSLSVR